MKRVVVIEKPLGHPTPQVNIKDIINHKFINSNKSMISNVSQRNTHYRSSDNTKIARLRTCSPAHCDEQYKPSYNLNPKKRPMRKSVAYDNTKNPQAARKGPNDLYNELLVPPEPKPPRRMSIGPTKGSLQLEQPKCYDNFIGKEKLVQGHIRSNSKANENIVPKVDMKKVDNIREFYRSSSLDKNHLPDGVRPKTGSVEKTQGIDIFDINNPLSEDRDIYGFEIVGKNNGNGRGLNRQAKKSKDVSNPLIDVVGFGGRGEARGVAVGKREERLGDGKISLKKDLNSVPLGPKRNDRPITADLNSKVNR